MKKVQSQIGDKIKGDNWPWMSELGPDNGYSDSSFPGCQFRVDMDHGINRAVNIKTTGGPRWNGYQYQSRCKIEFVGDGETSTFTGGLLYHGNRTA